MDLYGSFLRIDYLKSLIFILLTNFIGAEKRYIIDYVPSLFLTFRSLWQGASQSEFRASLGQSII